MEDRNVRTCMVCEQWRIKRTEGMIVWKIGNKNMYGPGNKRMEDIENRRYDSLED